MKHIVNLFRFFKLAFATAEALSRATVLCFQGKLTFPQQAAFEAISSANRNFLCHD